MFGALTQRTFRQTLLLTARVVKELTPPSVRSACRTRTNSSYICRRSERKAWKANENLLRKINKREKKKHKLAMLPTQTWSCEIRTMAQLLAHSVRLLCLVSVHDYVVWVPCYLANSYVRRHKAILYTHKSSFFVFSGMLVANGIPVWNGRSR